MIQFTEDQNKNKYVRIPGSSVHGVLQAKILEWVAISDPEIEPQSPALQADSLQSEPPGKSQNYYT